MTAKIAGTYSMTEISGTVTVGGVTTELSTGLYSKYDIVLNADGTAKIIAAASTINVESEASGTWKYEEGKLKLTSETSGISVTEVMDWNDGVITYETTQSASGMEISMKIVLEKK